MTSDADGLAEHTREFTAGEMAFRRGIRPDDGASVSFVAGWQSAALALRERFEDLGPLAAEAPATEIRAALEAAAFSLKNHASAKLRAADERKLGEARFKVTAALALFPEDGPQPAAPPAPIPPRVVQMRRAGRRR